MLRVVIESPFAGNIERNIAYAKLCIKDALLRKEAPIASHLLFTQPGILDDTKPKERELGIAAGHEWIETADIVAVYHDFGVSSGMEKALVKADEVGTYVEFRKLPKDVLETLNARFN